MYYIYEYIYSLLFSKVIPQVSIYIWIDNFWTIELDFQHDVFNTLIKYTPKINQIKLFSSGYKKNSFKKNVWLHTFFVSFLKYKVYTKNRFYMFRFNPKSWNYWIDFQPRIIFLRNLHHLLTEHLKYENRRHNSYNHPNFFFFFFFFFFIKKKKKGEN